jgi:hypothetical protein
MTEFAVGYPRMTEYDPDEMRGGCDVHLPLHQEGSVSQFIRCRVIARRDPVEVFG